MSADQRSPPGHMQPGEILKVSFEVRMPWQLLDRTSNSEERGESFRTQAYLPFITIPNRVDFYVKNDYQYNKNLFIQINSFLKDLRKKTMGS